jgi:phosphonate transport system substrate-binding protein
LIEKGFLTEKGDPATFFSRVFFAGAYDKALRAVVDRQADVAVVSDYTMEGDRADLYLPAEDRAKLRILYRVPGVPTHLIAVRGDLPAEQKTKIREALLKLAKEEPDLFADLYGAASFVEVQGDSHVESARKALQATGLSPETLVP